METHSRSWHQKHFETLTPTQKLADYVAAIIGSWSFIIFQTGLILIWIFLNVTAYIQHWDPYPFVLLNLLFSVQAAYAAPIIMMAQNRQSERDRIQATEDYNTNVTAKKEIEELQKSLARIETEKLDEILKRLK
ncbi:MAG TPA: hypothetical protein DEP87_04265 [Candidatus Pacebacteria bacterium]|nr:hypothetical protein [Candidatus Paceibacterota bacterium]